MVCITLQRSKSRHECCFSFKNKLRSRLISRRTRGLAPQRRGWNLEVARMAMISRYALARAAAAARQCQRRARGMSRPPARVAARDLKERAPCGTHACSARMRGCPSLFERSRRRHDFREIATGRCWTKRRARGCRSTRRRGPCDAALPVAAERRAWSEQVLALRLWGLVGMLLILALSQVLE